MRRRIFGKITQIGFQVTADSNAFITFEWIWCSSEIDRISSIIINVWLWISIELQAVKLHGPLQCMHLGNQGSLWHIDFVDLFIRNWNSLLFFASFYIHIVYLFSQFRWEKNVLIYRKRSTNHVCQIACEMFELVWNKLLTAKTYSFCRNTYALHFQK